MSEIISPPRSQEQLAAPHEITRSGDGGAPVALGRPGGDSPVTKEALFRHLKHGQDSGQDVKTLAFLVGTTERAIRQLVDDLIEAGTPVCAHPTTGYYIPETEAEVQAVCAWLHGRAVHSLGKISKLRSAFARSTGTDGANEPLPEL